MCLGSEVGSDLAQGRKRFAIATALSDRGSERAHWRGEIFSLKPLPWRYASANEKRITLRGLLRVAFGRWSIESCFREGKEELGMDHYEVRGWGCVHRHFYVTQLSHLFCARVREEFDKASDRPDRLSIEQVRSAMNVWLDSADLPSTARQQRYQAELDRQQYYQHRNRQARESHNKTRKQRLLKIGIDPDKIKSCIPPENNST